MEIQRIGKREKMQVQTLEPGTAFEWGKNLYMRTSKETEDVYNIPAVNLRSGSTLVFHGETEVSLVDAILRWRFRGEGDRDDLED